MAQEENLRLGQAQKKDWYWCPHHKKEGQYNDLYMTHKPEDHNAWQERKDRYKSGCQGRTDKENNSNTSNQNLGLSDKIKTVLIPDHGWTEL